MVFQYLAQRESGFSSAGRATGLHPVGRGFDPLRPHSTKTGNRKVPGLSRCAWAGLLAGVIPHILLNDLVATHVITLVLDSVDRIGRSIG